MPGELREWGSMRYLTEKIPHKAQLHLVHRDLELTSLSCLPSWVALGSNVGLVYLYHRPSDLLRRLRISGGFEGVVTSVKLAPISSTDEPNSILVAAGLDSGKIALFHVESESPAAISEVEMLEAHVTAITSLEWSQLCLYSGDREGYLHSTSLQLHHSKAEVGEPRPVMKETHEIVQLSCSPDGALLAVSTTQRTVIWEVENRVVRQVGRQERKCLEPLGAVFQQTKEGLVLYAARAGLRLWRADPESGRVIETIKFRGVEAAHMVALEATPSAVRNKDTPPSLSKLELFGSQVVAWSPVGSVLILDPYPTPRLAAKLPPLWQLNGVATCPNEVFLLVQPHTLVCLATVQPTAPRMQLREAQPVDILQEIWVPLERLGSMVRRGEDSGPGLLGWLRGGRKSSSGGEELPPVQPLDLPPLVLKPPDPLEDLPPIFGLLEDNGPSSGDVVVLGHKKKKKKKKLEKPESTESDVPAMETSVESVEVFPTPSIDPETALDQILAAYDRQDVPQPSTDVLEHPDPSVDVPDQPSTDVPSALPAEQLPKPTLRKKETFDIYSKDSLDLPDELETPEIEVPSTVTSDPGLSPARQCLQEMDQGSLYRGNWARCMVPGVVTSVAVWRDCVVCTCKDTVFVCPMGGIGLPWRAIRPRREASQVAADGPHLWLLYRGTAYNLPDSTVTAGGLNTAKWQSAETEVISLAVAGGIAWCLKSGGLVAAAHILPADQRSTAKLVDLPCVGAKMAANRDGLVWLLGQQSQLFCGRPLHPGSVWTPVRCPAGVRAFALGENSTGWVLDEFSHLWFTFDLTAGSVWWQAELREPVFQDDTTRVHAPSLSQLLNLAPLTSCLMASDKCGVWLARGSELSVATRRVVGHRWEEVSLGENTALRWKLVAAEGFSQTGGVVWALLTTGALFCWTDPATPRQVQPPDGVTVSGLSPSPGVLWLHTSAGLIYMRTGFSPAHPEGTGWVELNLAQLEGEQLTSVSCVDTVAWACTPEGLVYFSLGASQPPARQKAPARAWVPVSSSPPLLQVGLGRWHQVWALDHDGAVWARAGVTAEMPLGTDWVKIPGLSGCTRLSASQDQVWVYGPDGAFVRCGTALWGDYWQLVPCPHLHTLSAGGPQVWGLTQDTQLVVLQSEHLQLAPDPVQLPEGPSSPIDDWEVVDM